jgi:hypothetical protein
MYQLKSYDQGRGRTASAFDISGLLQRGQAVSHRPVPKLDVLPKASEIDIGR